MSDSLRTPLKQDDDNPSGDHTPDDWFRSPTVKTLRRRQLNLGTYPSNTHYTDLSEPNLWQTNSP